MAIFYDEIWEILNSGNLDYKFHKFDQIFSRFQENYYDLDLKSDKILELTEPSYAKFANVVQMKDIKKFKNKDVEFLHSIAHIEYSAIDIALDACYRFQGLNKEYYNDWLEVAKDEIRHFNMICQLLSKLGYKYGDLTVHNGLFIALQKTQNSLIERMAVLPRYMEANGLDANYFLINKIESNKDKFELIKILKIILKEEINHVYKGDKWFKFEAKRLNISNISKEYIKIVTRHYPKAFLTSRELNKIDRKMAGFSDEELDLIGSFQKEKI